MNFRFRRSLENNGTQAVTLVLKTEDPLLYRIGEAGEYPDVDEGELNRLVSDTLRHEYRAARRITELMDTEQFLKEKEKALDSLRFDAQELFTEMMTCGVDRVELERLNCALSETMGKKHDVELAFSKRNPWLRYYGKAEQTGGITGLAGIIVHATVLDREWLRHPAYPEERGNYKSLRGAKTAFGTPYVEPEIRILSYEPVVHCRKERDLLPAKWLEGGEEK